VKAIIEKSRANDRGLLIGKCGSNELAMLFSTPDNRAKLSKFFELHAGVWPAENLEGWVSDYLRAITKADVLASGWFEPLKQHELALLSKVNPNVINVKLRDLEPYYVPEKDDRWTTLLANKRVCVVSSFAKTMKSQLQRKRLIWGEADCESLLPSNATYTFIQTKHSPFASPSNTWANDIKTYADAVSSIVSNIDFVGSDVVLIGCGGLGLIIGERAKAMGKVAIVLGGAIQVLFGIKGKRWENHSTISKFWNDEGWVYPDPSEIPDRAKQIEGGCYW
jgi:hypothetical protein